MLDIIPLCDDVVKLKGICNRCKEDDAIFTHRTTVDNNHQTLVVIIFIKHYVENVIIP